MAKAPSTEISNNSAQASGEFLSEGASRFLRKPWRSQPSVPTKRGYLVARYSSSIWRAAATASSGARLRELGVCQ